MITSTRCVHELDMMPEQLAPALMTDSVLLQVAIGMALPAVSPSRKPIRDSPQWNFKVCYSFTIWISRNSRLKFSFSYSIGWMMDSLIFLLDFCSDVMFLSCLVLGPQMVHWTWGFHFTVVVIPLFLKQKALRCSNIYDSNIAKLSRYGKNKCWFISRPQRGFFKSHAYTLIFTHFLLASGKFNKRNSEDSKISVNTELFLFQTSVHLLLLLLFSLLHTIKWFHNVTPDFEMK